MTPAGVKTQEEKSGGGLTVEGTGGGRGDGGGSPRGRSEGVVWRC